MPISAPPTLTYLTAETWRQLREDHALRAERRTQPALKRRAEQRPHPIEDFLFTYYTFSFSKLREWHPPIGVALEASTPLPSCWQKAPYSFSDGWLWADPSSLPSKEFERIRWIRDLLVSTRHRPAHFGCYGMHEWAMVYRGKDIRHHETAPLRLSQEDVDRFVESRPIQCSHFDAFRFFAPEAKPLNKLQPGLWTRADHEQPGCVHANMDLYKWAGKAMPWVGTELWFACFELALQFRDLDMRASPYDLSEFHLEPIAIETAEGRRAYETEQRRLAALATPLRDTLIALLDQVLSARSD
ncbi:hypothetical protein HNR46_000732 [Haloferula luteola]|uniref:3-methyladenine DNA glycosylase n=1 Tax=Haloferula luteola TaxID=595692 RepID=A0A840V4D7_9BACT|nr:3-methyladenine DNA glycosylase [Haloferula luteola]MBB5350504.1 hypothetical protein [Haloferula luteola]